MSLLWPILRNGLFNAKRIAAVDDTRSYSYAETVGGAFFVAEDIQTNTSRPNVGVMLPTCGAFGITLLGSWIAGRTVVPFNYLLGKAELQHCITDSDVDTIYTVQPLIDHLVKTVGEDWLPKGVKVRKIGDDFKFTGFPEPVLPPFYGRNDTAVILYTSGTSGMPKGVELTHWNLQSNVKGIIDHYNMTSKDVFLGVLPQFHSFGLTVGTLLPLFTGAKSVYSARFVPKKIVSLIKEHHPTITAMVPSMYRALLNSKDLDPEDMAGMRGAISGGEALPKAVAEAYLERFSIRLMEGYGLTETAPVSNCNIPTACRAGSVGKPIPGVRNIIVDEDENPVPTGVDGEILISGSNVMQGYYKKPDATNEVFTRVTSFSRTKPALAFKTGDIGHVDAEGYLFITGRRKELIITAGENVSPTEIEDVLCLHEQVNAAGVIPQKDEARGEVPIAFVEPAEGVDKAAINTMALRTFCRDHLPPHKVPREVFVIDELPRNPTGKIMRRSLKAPETAEAGF